MHKFLFLSTLFYFSVLYVNAQYTFTAKNEIEGVSYTIQYTKHQYSGNDMWGKYFPYEERIQLGQLSITHQVKIPFTDILLSSKNYSLDLLPREHGAWDVIFKDEHANEISYSVQPFQLFDFTTETLLIYIDEPEPVNGMAFFRIIGQKTQIGFYLEPVK